MTGETLSGNSATRKPKKSDFCSKCNAWRGTFGLEPTPELYLEHSVLIFREVKRVLRKDGTLWLNLGDSYASHPSGDFGSGSHPGDGGAYRALKPYSTIVGGLKPGDLCGIPWRVALALQADGWFLRRDNIWFKNNPMPESVRGWTWEQHRVRRSVHEKMCKLQTTECNDENRATDLRDVPRREDGGSEIKIPSKLEGNSDRPCEGKSASSEGATPSLQSFSKGQGKAKNLHPVGEGEVNSPQNLQTIPTDREGKGVSSTAGSQASTRSAANRKAEGISSSILEDTQGTDDGSETRGATQGMDELRESPDYKSMATHPKFKQEEVLLVPKKNEEGNNRSCNPIIEGRTTRGEQRGPSVPILQLDKTGQDADPLVNCPGCDKCTHNGGLILRKGNWRCTTAHEYVFQFSKSDSYFCDGEAGRERSTYVPRRSVTAVSRKGTGRRDTDRQVGDLGRTGNRNRRSVWQIPTAPYRDAHFATFPTNLVRPIIAAATSPKCCAACGAPYAPVIERGPARREQQLACGSNHNGEYHGEAIKDFAGTRAENASEVKARILAGMVEKRVIGYRASCTCPGLDGDAPGSVCADDDNWPTNLCVVLDPFGGSGTVAQVANELGRAAIIIELQANYIPMIHKRCSVTQGLAL
jgi:hypothetical protein